MQILERIKEIWPLVTKRRFLRMKADKEALLRQHKDMSDYVLLLNKQTKEAEILISQAKKALLGIDF